MKKNLIILMVLIYLFIINICILPNSVNALEDVNLNTLTFNATQVDVDNVKLNIDETVKIPVTLDFTGNVSMITVAFENEKGDKYGPASIYIDSLGKKDLEIQTGMPLVAGTTYYLTDVFFMRNTGNEYDILKHYVTSKSKTSANGYDIVELDYNYSFKAFSSSVENAKLNTLKFNETEVDIDKVKTNIDETVNIPVELDFTGDVAMITVAFENEKGDKYGPASIYIDSLGKNDLEIQTGMPLVAGTTYYLTDVYFMKNTENGYDILKHYVTSKSKTFANGYDIVQLDYDYSFKAFSSNSSNVNEEQNEEQNEKQKDTTVATGTIPKAGTIQNIFIFLSIITIGTIITIILFRYKKLKNI